MGDQWKCETGIEVATDTECRGCLAEWLQRLGMVTIQGKISTCLLVLSSPIYNIGHLKIMISYFYFHLHLNFTPSVLDVATWNGKLQDVFGLHLAATDILCCDVSIFSFIYFTLDGFKFRMKLKHHIFVCPKFYFETKSINVCVALFSICNLKKCLLLK